jgi:hypothetical protein
LLLALALADWANHDGDGIWAAIPKMAGKTRQSDRTIQYQLRRMRASGWLQITSQGGGGRLTTTYRIPVELIPPLAEGVVQKLHLSNTSDCAPGVQSTTGEVQSTTKRGATAIAPKPLSIQKQPSTAERATRATRLKGNWVLPKAWGEWALTAQPTWTAEHVRKIAANFYDHWIAAPKGTKLDWFATWRKWVRGEPALKGGNGAAAKPWYLTASGVEAKGRELGIEIPADKSGWASFLADVYKRAGVTAEMLRTAKVDHG